MSQEVDVQDSGGCRKSLNDVALPRQSMLFHLLLEKHFKLAAGFRKIAASEIDIHNIALDAHQYQAAVALLIFFADLAVVRSAPRRFFLVGFLEVVRANDGIFRIQREELDTARR